MWLDLMLPSDFVSSLCLMGCIKENLIDFYINIYLYICVYMFYKTQHPPLVLQHSHSQQLPTARLPEV